MKALAFNEFGGPDKLKLQDVPDPKITPNDVLVRVKACALNHLDIFVREGIPALKTPLPFWTGCDIAGEIAEVGAQAQGVKVGDRVAVNPNLTCGRCEFCAQGEDSLCVKYGILGEHVRGGLAEYVAVRADNVLPLPAKVSFEEAASFVLTNMTAWRMVVTQGQVRPGQDVFEATGKRGVDVVIENVGAATWKDSIRSLKGGGRLVTCGATSGNVGETLIPLVFWKQVHIIGSTMANRKEFHDVMSQFFAGRLKAIIDEVVPLKDGAAAQQRLAEGKQFGKIVLTP